MSPGAVRRATVYGSALGIYRLHINGRAGGRRLSSRPTGPTTRSGSTTTLMTLPIWSAPNGQNAIGGVLAAGWYSGGIGWQPDAATTMATSRGCSPNWRSNWPTARSRPSATDDTWKIGLRALRRGRIPGRRDIQRHQGNPRLVHRPDSDDVGLAAGGRHRTRLLRPLLQAFSGRDTCVRRTSILRHGEDHRAQAGRLRV